MNGDFSAIFSALTGFAPLPWQTALYDRFTSGRADPIPSSCNLPTGLGKTAVVAIWLIALAKHGDRIPRRLVYVVNRRTVVDQTTREVERLRDRLLAPEKHAHEPEHVRTLRALAHDLAILSRMGHEHPLAISTLRGQFADNQEWSADPSRPAVICGTVDMIGSRLLFSGYSSGFKSRPLHAGFLGQDALLIHDEAHLEPAFQALIEAIRREQARCHEFAPFHVMELTATTRGESRQAPSTFTLTPADSVHPLVKQRIEARKLLQMTPVADEKQVAGKVADLAARYRDANAAVLVFVRTLEAVGDVEAQLVQTGRPVLLLTGTMRGKERDELVRSPEFGRFQKGAASGETTYLVCTSAGEVGIDISADHMVSDLSTLDSMAQRFGRVNRYGERVDTRIDLVHPASFGRTDRKTGEWKADEIDERRRKTLDLLRALDGDASPAALSHLWQRSDLQGKVAGAFAPMPTILPTTDILLDAWALTTVRQRMPGRQPVAPYLHGLAEWQPAETRIAWRREVEIVTGDLLTRNPPADLLDDYPLKPHELLRERSDRAFKQIEALAEHHGGKPVWVLDDRGAVHVTTLGELATREWKDGISDSTILLPPGAGGLAGGMLDGASEYADDVADIPASQPGARIRVWSDDPEYESKTSNMRRVRGIETEAIAEEDEPRSWEWFDRIASEGGRAATKPVTWDTHVSDVVERAEKLLAGLPLPGEIARSVLLAARLHDHGKRREGFQLALGNRRYPDVLWAKSGRAGARLPEAFRHEFASLFDAHRDPEFSSLSEDLKDLVLHLIAAHHGRARPHFEPAEAFDPEHSVSSAETLAIEIPRRFARLQRRYGRWGLAYLESLVRAADWAASAAPSAYLEDSDVQP